MSTVSNSLSYVLLYCSLYVSLYRLLRVEQPGSAHGRSPAVPRYDPSVVEKSAAHTSHIMGFYAQLIQNRVAGFHYYEHGQ
jgi:hypothetical protein